MTGFVTYKLYSFHVVDGFLEYLDVFCRCLIADDFCNTCCVKKCCKLHFQIVQDLTVTCDCQKQSVKNECLFAGYHDKILEFDLFHGLFYQFVSVAGPFADDKSAVLK